MELQVRKIVSVGYLSLNFYLFIKEAILDKVINMAKDNTFLYQMIRLES